MCRNIWTKTIWKLLITLLNRSRPRNVPFPSTTTANISGKLSSWTITNVTSSNISRTTNTTNASSKATDWCTFVKSYHIHSIIIKSNFAIFQQLDTAMLSYGRLAFILSDFGFIFLGLLKSTDEADLFDVYFGHPTDALWSNWALIPSLTSKYH